MMRHQNQGHPVKNREHALPNIPLHICQQLTLSAPSMLSDSVPILKMRSLVPANSDSEVTVELWQNTSYPLGWVALIYIVNNDLSYK
jgi:hypothetical protein